MVLSISPRGSHYRKHRNLYDRINLRDVTKIVKFEPFFMLLIGQQQEIIYEQYKAAM